MPANPAAADPNGSTVNRVLPTLLAAPAAAALVLCLGACSPTAAAGAASSTPPPSEIPATSAGAAAELPDGALGGATLFDPAGAAIGTVEIARSDGEFLEVRAALLPGAPVDRTELMLAPRPIADDETCFDSGARFGLGTPDESAPARWAIADLGSGDPSFLDEAVLVQAPLEPTADEDCFADIVAHGPIEWTFAPLRSGLAPIDHGATGGARGAATLEGGVPVAYTVAPGDLIDEVAARFGVTVDDVHYLNPARVTTGGVDTLHPDEVLNLVVERR